MITRSNFPELLISLGFTPTDKIYHKTINGYELKVDVANEKLIYPEGIRYGRETTVNFSQAENFVVFECVHNLLTQGYKPSNITLEPSTPGGHKDKPTYGDILISNNEGKEYMLIECKTTEGKNGEFEKEWSKMKRDGGQLFNYYNSFRSCEWLCLYTSDLKNDSKVEYQYHLIFMRDSKDALTFNEGFRTFEKVKQEQGNKDDYFNVWVNTYKLHSINVNLFESAPFKIGKRPYNVNDLKIVDNNTIQKKYHQFATIMRKHNVSARENAFDKLVNIFLCKIVDEKNNPNDLKVYWKGEMIDSHYDLQDRLQQLYKIGMYKFLGEEVTYISENEITNAFKLFKNQKDTTRDTILKYFTELKFHSNNPFAFLDVHNKPLFFQNAEILKEVVQMLQDIKLKNEEEQHQFLGDLFEGFLDQGVKQSEGQFFTPMPIVKFLISSLPLEQILQNENAPKVIDYACGAGHFLTEYASQIKPLLTDSGRNLSEFYQKIYGIEKEYRLSKVAKVSAFMYGQDEMNIIYADALAQNQEQGKALQDGSFSLLVANPPYSVKGFLSTLSDEDKAKFTLYENIDNEETFNSIETFFIEKAKQLLHAEGIAVIVLPSSILTNGNIYIKCREILLQHFDLVAIAEFGSGTFGKTGTNTATLFLRRKQAAPNLAEHYKNRIGQWQSGNFGFDALFEDHHLLQSYCNHCGFNLDDYKAFLSAIEEMPSAIAETELFQEYRKAFEKRKFAKSVNLAKEWLNFAKAIEADKMQFFMLAQNNPQDVLVVKMPADNKEKKAFLGYEWSSAKGNEGIKYLNQTSSDEDDSLAKLKGINQIQTPLFNPQNLFDETKINSLIRQNFNQQAVEIPQTLANYVSLLPLTQMLDFSRVDFDKAIRTSVQKKIEIVSKYPLQSIADIFPIIESGKRPSGGVGQYTDGAYSLGGEHIHKENGRLELKEIKFVPMSYFNKANKGIIQNNDILICKDGALTGKIAIIRDELNDVPAMVNEHVFILRTTNLITQKYAFHILHSEMGQNLLKANITGAAQGGLNSTNLKNIKIPLPHLDIQTKIVNECEKIDAEFNRTRMQIEEYRAKIAKIFNDLEIAKGGVKRFKINELCSISSGGTPSRKESRYWNGYIPWVKTGELQNTILTDTEEKITQLGLENSSAKLYSKGSIIIAMYGATIGQTAKLGIDATTNQACAVLFDFNEKSSNDFVWFYLRTQTEKLKNLGYGSAQPNLNARIISEYEILIPDLNEQQSIVNQINEIEAQISELEKVLANSKQAKKAVLDKWL